MIKEHERGAGGSSGGGSDSDAPRGGGLPQYSEDVLAQLRRGRSHRAGSGDEGGSDGGGLLHVDVGALEREARKRRRAHEGVHEGRDLQGQPEQQEDEKENSGAAGGDAGVGGGSADKPTCGAGSVFGSTTDLSAAAGDSQGV